MPVEIAGNATDASLWLRHSAIARRWPAIAVPVVLVAAVAGGTVVAEAQWMGALGRVTSSGFDGIDAIDRFFGLVLLAEILVLVLAGVTVYWLIRWSLAFPALVIEGIGLRAALGRSSDLTRGHRVTVALTIFVVTIVTSLVLQIATFVSTAVVGAATPLDSAAGIALSSLGVLVASVVVAPFLPLTLVFIYRDLRDSELPADAR